ncbi:Cholesterol 7-alpha-monooxygenase [Apiospora arundinis]|uniref:Fungal-specific transcription factor domain-containing protein n=1 Tax=Apiospora arundinis TaxID=335852 RepID=A0ABR2IV87_9PEZI
MPKNQLHWQPGFTLSRKPAKKSIARRNKAGGGAKEGSGPQQYEFICEYPVATSHAQKRPKRLAASEEPDASTTAERPVTSPAAIQSSPGADSTNNIVLASNSSGEQEAPSGAACLDGSGSSGYPTPERTGPTADSTHTVEAPLMRLGATQDSPRLGHHDYTLAPTSVMYNSISHRFGPILNRYNKEFCKIPLTADLQVNPFQYQRVLDTEPIFLLHAVMALAGHHVESPTTEGHHRKALQLLREGLNVNSGSDDIYHFLDTIIILFSLDETQSTLGNWSTHLTGAFSLLEASGGIQKWTQSPRAVVQVALLTWWDAITSLVSREDCVFPHSYFEAVLANSNGQKGWDYFRLCGCPLPLVRAVMRLARLSAEKSKSSTMQYVKLDDAVISELEQSLEAWQHVSPSTADEDESAMQEDMDSMHCSEAWRHGLLIYMYRVFRWEPGSRTPVHVARRARVVADHVFACRADGLVAKQALLPLFFAGCELRDESTRGKILEYCSLWNVMTRYHMFESAIPLLNEVWADQEQREFENAWWGQVADRKHEAKPQHPLRMRLCFG